MQRKKQTEIGNIIKSTPIQEQHQDNKAEQDKEEAKKEFKERESIQRKYEIERKKSIIIIASNNPQYLKTLSN